MSRLEAVGPWVSSHWHHLWLTVGFSSLLDPWGTTKGQVPFSVLMWEARVQGQGRPCACREAMCGSLHCGCCLSSLCPVSLLLLGTHETTVRVLGFLYPSPQFRPLPIIRQHQFKKKKDFLRHTRHHLDCTVP